HNFVVGMAAFNAGGEVTVAVDVIPKPVADDGQQFACGIDALPLLAPDLPGRQTPLAHDPSPLLLWWRTRSSPACALLFYSLATYNASEFDSSFRFHIGILIRRFVQQNK